MNDDRDVPGLDDVLADVDDVDTEAEADELLEGLLGADAADRDDVPTVDDTDDTETDDGHPDDVDRDRDAAPWVCRFCQERRRDAAAEPAHHEICTDSQRHFDELEREADADPGDEPSLPDREDRGDREKPTAASDEPGEQHTYLVATAWHEFRAYLKCQRHGLDPYYALHALMRRTNWRDGPPTAEITHAGTTYTVEFSYRQTENEEKQIAPWEDPSFQIERPREFNLKVEGPGDLRKANFHIRPRWPGISLRDGTEINNPRDMTGVDVDAEGSNLPPGEYPELLDKAMQAFDVNGGSDYPRKRYLSPPNVEPWSVVVDGERYVRIHEDYSGRIIGLKGPLERMSYLLADERGGYRKRVADDTKTEGHYHTTTLGSVRSRELLDGHQLGKEAKHYHVRNRDALDDDDPLRQPKVGVSFQHRISDTTVYWNRAALDGDGRADSAAIGLDDMSRELDETLLNVLQWADIPTRPDGQVFVQDNVFKPDLDRRERRLVADPLPVIENEQEHMVTRALNKMTDIDTSTTDAEVITELVTDGGEHSPQGLADRLGYHYETILTSLRRLSDVVEHQYGDVQLKSRHVAERLAERAGRLLEDFGRVNREIDRLGSELANAVEGLGTENSPFKMWADEYLKGIEDPDDDPRILLRFGYRPADLDEARKILREGLTALRRTLGSDVADSSRLARWGKAQLNLRDGTRAGMDFTVG